MDYPVITLAEAGPELASAPFETHARMTQIAMAERPMGFIADDVMPRVSAPFKFRYTKAAIEDQFSIPDTRASRAGRLGEVEFGATLADGSTEDRGLIAYIPYRDIAEARQQQSAWDPVAQSAMGLGNLMALDREQRVSRTVFNVANYGAGLSAVLAGNAQWSSKRSDPLAAIIDALDKCITRPNCLVMGQAVWTKLRTHAAIVEAVKATGAGAGGDGAQASGIVAKRAVAELFEVDRILVGAAWHQGARRGQDPAWARLWGKHCAALHIRRPAGTQDAMPTWGFTAEAMVRQVSLSEEPSRGVGRGSRAMKISESCQEIVSWNTAGYLWRNAVG